MAQHLLPYLSKESHVFVLRAADRARNERRADERKRRLALQRGARPDQERNGINGGDPRSGVEAVYAGFDLERA
jgi:hypothetical protein